MMNAHQPTKGQTNALLKLLPHNHHRHTKQLHLQLVHPVRHRRPERLTPPADIRKRCECPTRKRSGIPACRPGARAGQVGLCRLRTGLSVTLTGPVAPVRLACFVASIGCSGRQSQWHPASFRATRACTRRLGQEFRRRRCSPTVKKPRPRRTKARVAATLLLVPVNASAGASGSGTATAGAASAATAAGFAHGSASGGAFTISGDGNLAGLCVQPFVMFARNDAAGSNAVFVESVTTSTTSCTPLIVS